MRSPPSWTEVTVALNPATGFAVHCDATIANLEFRGLFVEPTRLISTDLPAAGPVLILVKRPWLYTMRLKTGTTLNRGATALGTALYAVDSGSVQVGVVGLTNANKIGYYWDIAGAKPETNTGATWVWISPAPIN